MLTLNIFEQKYVYHIGSALHKKAHALRVKACIMEP